MSRPVRIGGPVASVLAHLLARTDEVTRARVLAMLKAPAGEQQGPSGDRERRAA